MAWMPSSNGWKTSGSDRHGTILGSWNVHTPDGSESERDPKGMVMATRLPAAFAALGAALLAGGCAFINPAASVPAGSSVGDATRTLGRPTGEYALPGGGKRLEFARGPYGKHTWMLDFDALGRAAHDDPGADRARTSTRVRAGMTRDEVLLALGRPSETRRAGLAAPDGLVVPLRHPVLPLVPDRASTAAARSSTARYSPDPMCEDNVTDRDGTDAHASTASRTATPSRRRARSSPNAASRCDFTTSRSRACRPRRSTAGWPRSAGRRC